MPGLIRYRILALLCFFFLGHDRTIAQAVQTATSAWEKIIPSSTLPREVRTGRSNNNLDLIWWQDKFFVAFRTAPSHFASQDTKLFILSTADFHHWQFERAYAMGYDLREPRFVLFRDTLRFYFFQGGTDPLKFEPQHIFTDAGNGLVQLGLDGYVPWRLRVRDSVLYLSAYFGKDIYNDSHRPDLRLFRSDDGYTFTPVTTMPQDTTLGAEEGEFLFDHNGKLWANIRLEGSGSLLCYADKDSIGHWHKKFSPYKYDSALMFEQDNEIYMIARRHIRGKATKVMLPSPFRRKWNMFKYSLTRKTTSLYRLDQQGMQWETVCDFPSTGDTAFPAVACDPDGNLHVLNYSNDIRKKDKVWIFGQLMPTFIYHAVLNLK